MNRCILLLCLTISLAAPGAAQNRPAATMPAFASDSSMMAFLRRIVAQRGEARRAVADMSSAQGAPMAGFAQAQAAGESDAITNTQHSGVDEGDIVKLRGDYLVILRRGRLFTVAVGGGALRPAARSDAFGPDIDPSGTWYDEMLISGDKIVVIGYSYARGGTEAGIFRLGDSGDLRHLATFQLRSNDYYSSRNYASRLIGSRLVFYAPLYLPGSVEELPNALPAVQRWNPQGTSRFVPIVRPERTFRPAGWRPTGDAALHTVTSCDLAAAEVSCEASVVIGPPGNVFYVSRTAVYVWMADWSGNGQSMLARLPLGAGRPTATRVSGSPADQFSFLEEGGYINVLTLAGAAGGQMWEGEHAGGNVSLLRMPLDSMGDGRRAAPGWWYRPLPPVKAGTMQNRFAGDYVLYGTGSGWGGEEPASRTLFAVPFRGGDLSAIRLTHGTDRIEVMGGDAVVIGVRGQNLHFSGVRLRGTPALAQRYVLHNASQGELRSHGFFYRADGVNEGIIGLPVREAERPGWAHLVDGSAGILFLRNSEGAFSLSGRLSAGEVRSANDNCRASCVDWYGNARPIFARGRVFALMGYEIVEGRMQDGRIRELRRASFAPEAGLAAR